LFGAWCGHLFPSRRHTSQRHRAEGAITIDALGILDLKELLLRERVVFGSRDFFGWLWSGLVARVAVSSRGPMSTTLRVILLASLCLSGP
jgi:hypothetical protein